MLRFVNSTIISFLTNAQTIPLNPLPAFISILGACKIVTWCEFFVFLNAHTEHRLRGWTALLLTRTPYADCMLGSCSTAIYLDKYEGMCFQRNACILKVMINLSRLSCQHKNYRTEIAHNNHLTTILLCAVTQYSQMHTNIIKFS